MQVGLLSFCFLFVCLFVCCFSGCCSDDTIIEESSTGCGPSQHHGDINSEIQRLMSVYDVVKDEQTEMRQACTYSISLFVQTCSFYYIL